MAIFTSNELQTFRQGVHTAPSIKNPTVTPPKKGPGGIKGFLVNALPAIGGGVGAVAGIPGDLFSAGASSVAGGAAGAGLGETLKRKILGEKLDPKQIAIQAAEGGAFAGAGGALKGASNAAKGFVKGGAQTLTKTAAEDTAEKSGDSFFKKLVTQGKQKQGNTAGVSFGSTAKGSTIESPQETEKMLNILDKHSIPVGNANNTGSALKAKLDQFGQKIADHFKTNNAPLHSDDLDTIGNNFIKSLKTTDPAILDRAETEVNDLKKNVTDEKSFWEHRKQLDGEIPKSKQATDENLSNKIYVKKAMRQYISKELGHVDGMKDYSELSSVKPFVVKEGNRLNNPGGGIAGRVLSSGPVQKGENLLGKAMVNVGERGSKVEAEAPKIASGGDDLPPPTPPTSFLNKLTSTTKSAATLPARAAAAPLAYPGQTAVAIGKQEVGRGFGVPASISQQEDNPSEQDTSGILDQADQLLASQQQPTDNSSSPYDTANVQQNIQSIIEQGGKQKDVADYLANVEAYQKLTAAPSSKPLNASQQQQANNAISGLKDIQSIASMLKSDPGISAKDAIPGGSIAHRLTGTTDYEAAKSNIVDVISRLRSGAAISASEEKLYKSLLPQAGDSTSSAQNKLNRLSQLLSSFASPQPTGNSDLEDALSGLNL